METSDHNGSPVVTVDGKPKRISSAFAVLLCKRVLPPFLILTVWLLFTTNYTMFHVFWSMRNDGLSWSKLNDLSHDHYMLISLSIAIFALSLVVLGLIVYLLRLIFTSMPDEVLDAGDALILRFGSRSERVALAEIKSIRCFASRFNGQAPGFELKLLQPAPKGRTFYFSSSGHEFQYCQHPMTNELSRRVEVAKSGAKIE